MGDAQTAFLQSLFKDNGVGSDPTLNAFQKTVAQNDYWRQAAAPVLSAQFDRSTWTPMQNIGVSAAQSFIGSLLNSLGANSEAKQLQSAAAILPQLYQDPNSVAMPEGMDPEAFQGLRLSAARENVLRGVKQEELKNNILAELFTAGQKKQMDINAAGPMKLAEKSAELQALDASSSPDAPNRKNAQLNLENVESLRKEFNGLQDVKDFSAVLKAANAMSGALKDKSKVSDQELVRYSILMIEPGMAVREGEQNAVAASQSIPDAWRGELNGALESGTRLSDKTREGLQRLAARAYESKKSNYDKALGYYQGRAVERNMPADQSISYLGEAPSADSIFSVKPTFNKEEAMQQAAKLKAQGMSPDLIAKTLREYYGQ